jgi:glycerol-3-phosphate dehydrogenase
VDHVDCIVAGAGVIGLAIARETARRGMDTLILEAENAIGTGTSSRNSEVIHAGIYYPAGSLKARLCVAGRERLYRYCQERAVPHARCGKLIVATEPGELERLELPEPSVGSSRIRATVLYVDRYGNVQLNLTRDHLEKVGIVPGTKVELEVGWDRVYAVAARTFADAQPGDVVVYEDAYRNIALAINRGSAAQMLRATVGQELRLGRAT